jgi:hypothetical protein
VLKPFEPLSAGPILLLNLLEQSFEYEGSAAEEYGMLLEQYFEGFASDLPVEEKVLVVSNEQDSGSTCAEVLQMPSFDAQCVCIALVLDLESVIVDLHEVSSKEFVVAVAGPYRISQFAGQFQKWEDCLT